MDSEGACLMCSRRTFHSLGPAVEKALSPLHSFDKLWNQRASGTPTAMSQIMMILKTNRLKHLLEGQTDDFDEQICSPKLLFSLFHCILYNLKSNKYYISSKLTVQFMSLLSLYFHKL